MQINETNQIEDDEDFIVLPELTEEEQKQMQIEHRQRLELFYSASKNYTMENWYDSLKKFTFKSISFTITNIEAYYLSSLYHEDTLQLNKPQMKDAGKSLQKKVDTFICEHFPQGCFMKLSTRSPKDRGWDYRNENKKNQQVKKLLSKLQGKVNHLDKALINKIYRYFLQQSKEKLKVTSGEQFINIFSHSDRIQIDINDMAYIQNNMFGRFSKNNYQYSNQPFIGVWGRQWVNFSWMEQFRCFYNNYTLTAITQYDQRCFFPQLQNKQEQIKNKISQLFENTIPQLKKLQLSKGVMDIIVKLDSDHDPILIQINIFDHNSRGSLFSWDDDRKIIEEGPLTIRILPEEKDINKWELTKMMGMIQKGIQSVIDEVMKKLGLEQQWQKYQ